jgi:alpha/beta superfamily hydrolase
MKKFLVISIGIIFILGFAAILLPLGFLSDQRSYHEVSIPGEGFQIRGHLSEGTDPNGDWIILLHSNRKVGQDHELFRVIRENLPIEYSVLAIDMRGFGGSSGNGINQAPNTIDRGEDLQTVENYLAENYGIQQNQIILIGHSFGAAQVMREAQDQNHRLVIPIGLGDWDALIENPTEIQQYIRKFQLNTGATLEPEILREEGMSFTAESLFSNCPSSPIWLVYASQDDSKATHWVYFNELKKHCQSKLNWSEITPADHFYGTEFEKLPEPIRGIYSRISLSLLIYRINGILSQVGR